MGADGKTKFVLQQVVTCRLLSLVFDAALFVRFRLAHKKCISGLVMGFVVIGERNKDTNRCIPWNSLPHRY